MAIEATRTRAVDARTEEIWRCADDTEKRILVEELVEWVTIFPDHLEVTGAGAPALNVLYSEVGLMGSDCWCRRADLNDLRLETESMDSS